MKKYLALCAGILVLSSCSSSEEGDGDPSTAGTGNATAGSGGASGEGNNQAGEDATGNAGDGNGGSSTAGTGNPEAGAGNEAGAANGGAGGDSGNGGAAGEGGSGPMIPMGYATCDGTPLPELALEEVASANGPIAVKSEPLDASRLYILERGGNVLLKDGEADPVEILAIDGVDTGGERGLLGIAFHPNFGVGEERRFYLAFAGRGGGTVSLYEYAMSANDPNVVDMASEQQLRSVQHGANNHNGGDVAFGPDGYLYWSVGDGGAQCDGQGSAQNLGTKLGSIVRIDVDNPDTPPAGNLSVGGADTDIFHWGFRNPYRISFDLGTGDLYIGEVGQDTWEEISLAPMGSEGQNFGWPDFEGNNNCGCCNNNTQLQPPGSQAVPPIFEYQHQGQASIIGGFVYRGSAIPELVGRYIYSDWNRNDVWIITYDGEEACENTEVTDQIGVPGIGGYGQDANGEVYVTSLNTGTVYRIVPAN